MELPTASFQIIGPRELPPSALWIALLGVFGIVTLFTWIWFDARRHARRLEKEHPNTGVAPKTAELDWEMLSDVACDVIERTISGFHPELRAEAERLGWLFYKWSNDVGVENVLGHFWGPHRSRGSGGDSSIVLYLGNLWEYSTRRAHSFEDEVRITYLHELGHYLGLDEDDLKARGLG